MTFDRHEVLVRKYREEIGQWKWGTLRGACLEYIEFDYDGDAHGHCWIGSVQSLTPSGKIYAPWTTNQTAHDVQRDEAWWEALEAEAADHGLYVSTGAGSSDDIFVYRPLDINDFVEGYMECALWVAEIHPDRPWDEEVRKKILRDCYDFMDANAEAIDEATHGGDYTWSMAGHDFFLTRNRHGAGFWDRGLGEVGEVLTKAARAYGETFVEVNEVTGMVEDY